MAKGKNGAGLLFAISKLATHIVEKGQAQIVKMTLTLKEYRQQDENPSKTV